MTKIKMPETFVFSEDNKPDSMDASEWQARCELAAAFRIADLYGWTDLVYTHFSVMVPGSTDFLMNPFGMQFGEMTATSLIRLDCEGEPVEESPYSPNPAGVMLHRRLHKEGIVCIIHPHAPHSTAVSLQADGLLPISQKALSISPLLAYHAYEGMHLNETELDRILEVMKGGKKILLMQAHGAMTIGDSVAEAVNWFYRLESAARLQTLALPGCQEFVSISETALASVNRFAEGYKPGGMLQAGKLEWPSMIRQIERAGHLDYVC